MKSYIFFSLFFFLQLLPGFRAIAKPLVLTKGDVSDPITGKFYDMTVANTIFSSGAYGMKAFTNLGDGDDYYILVDSLLGKFNIVSKKFSSWPLSRWQYQYYSPEITEHHKMLFHKYPLPFDYEGVGPGVGCLGDSPLRYGDIEGDGKKELVVILNGLFIVFSVEHERVVFAEYQDESDWMDTERMTQFFDGKPVKAAQFVSEFLAENDTFHPGVRAYSKLFVGDFDQDKHADIVVWRKSYRSNKVGDPVKGFTKLRDVFQHFERDLAAQEKLDAGVTGEYLPQETESEAIQAWLDKEKLTWKQGYPSKSECEGQVNQLIVQMHDPLLNDPDVLK